MQLKEAICTLPLDISLFTYFHAQQIELLPWQFQAIMDAIGKPETAWRWGRGMSKTFLFSHLSVYLALRGLDYYYYAPSHDQMKQISKYYQNNPFVKDITDEWVYPIWGNAISKKLITNKQTRSGRPDCVGIDEEASCEPHQEDFLDNIDYLLSHSRLPRLHHASTPVVSTPFEETCNRLEKCNAVSHHNYLNTPNILPNGRYIVNPQLMEEKKQKYLNEGRYWKYEAECLALFVVAGGQVFKNLIIHEDPADFPIDIKRTGTDFHGEYGAVVVGCCDNVDDIYFTHEFRYPMPNGKFDYSFYNSYRNCVNSVEGGGFNDGYAKFCQQSFGCIIAENNSKARSLRLENALRYKLHICPTLTPELYEDLRTAKWDKNGLTYIKDDDHPCHYLDAAMLSLKGIIGTGVWGKQIQTINNNVLAQDRIRRLSIRK